MPTAEVCAAASVRHALLVAWLSAQSGWVTYPRILQWLQANRQITGRSYASNQAVNDLRALTHAGRLLKEEVPGMRTRHSPMYSYRVPPLARLPAPG